MTYHYRLTIDLNTLERIIYLSEVMDISLAAVHLDSPEHTVSSSLSRIENVLGMKLFSRAEDRKKLTGITEAGKAFVDYAAAILSAKKTFDRKISHIRLTDSNKAYSICGTKPRYCHNSELP